MSLVRFFFSKYFWINLVVYFLVVGGSLWAVMYALDEYTMHGETLTVPDLSGFHSTELEGFLANKDLNYIVIDSIYDQNAQPGVVVDQNPKPGFQVKKGRKIYLTINANSPKKVKFPDLRDVTLRQANAILETYDIKIGRLKYKPDQCVNCVLGAQIDSTAIEPGTLITVGTTIDLVLGSGLSEEYINVPMLIDRTYSEAEDRLMELGLNLGAVNYEDCKNKKDSSTALVFKQIPAHDADGKIQLGESVTIFLTSDTSRIPEVKPDTVDVSGL